MKTEAEVYRAIVKRFPSPAYAVLPGVSNATGAGKRRTVDAIIMSLWPSRGLTLEGVEIKVSRRDWLREMKDPAKQEPVIKYCDRFWLAVGDESIVEASEVPATWGLLVPGKAGKMKIAKQAPDLEVEPISRGFLAAILRRANEATENDEIRESIRAEVEADHAETMDRLRARAMPADVQRQADQLRELKALVETFESISGVYFDRWSSERVERAAKIVRDLRDAESSLDGAKTVILGTIRRLTETVERIEYKDGGS